MIYLDSEASGSLSNEFMWVLIIFFVFIILLFAHLIYRWYRVYSHKHESAKDKEPEVTIKKIPSPKFKLMVGGTYLYLERTQKDYGQGFKIFNDILRSGEPGLVITRTIPEKIKQKYNLTNTHIIWLTRSKKKDTITPTNLGNMIEEVKEYTSHKKNSIIIFDGLEYLIVHNDFERVLKFIHSLRDEIAVNDARLIISLNPKTISKNQIALLTKEIKVLN
jgi:hypothetical protein